MKQLLTIAFVAILVSGCRKEMAFSASEEVNRIRSVVMDSMGMNAAASFNLNNIAKVTVSQDSIYYLIRSKKEPDAFVALWMNRQGQLVKGVQLEMKQDATDGKPWKPFNGKISIRSLNGNQLVLSKVRNGYIESFHNRSPRTLYGIAPRTNVAVVQPDPYETLSEVVVIGYRSTGGTYNYSNWMSISSMFGSSSWYYAPVSGGGGGSTAPTSDDGIVDIDAIRIDDETGVTLPAIDVNKYLDCFDRLPDAGATCSIEILTDIPVDTDPNKLVDWRAGSAGHTFIQLRKQVGGSIIVQNIGFYPVQSWKVTLTNAPVPGKFVDNGNHEFNASLLINVSPDNFRRALNQMRYLARSSAYDLDEFNCTDLAVQVFNAAGSMQLDVPLYQIPGGLTAGGTSTPQGVYNKLKEMQSQGSLGSATISTPGYKGFVGNSNGACN